LFDRFRRLKYLLLQQYALHFSGMCVCAASKDTEFTNAVEY